MTESVETPAETPQEPVTQPEEQPEEQPVEPVEQPDDSPDLNPTPDAAPDEAVQPGDDFPEFVRMLHEPDSIPTPEPGDEGRNYIVLRQKAWPTGEIGWIVVGRTAADNPADAREAIVSTLPADEQNAQFVTLAAKFWNPRSPKVSQVLVRDWG